MRPFRQQMRQLEESLAFQWCGESQDLQSCATESAEPACHRGGSIRRTIIRPRHSHRLGSRAGSKGADEKVEIQSAKQESTGQAMPGSDFSASRPLANVSGWLGHVRSLQYNGSSYYAVHEPYSRILYVYHQQITCEKPGRLTTSVQTAETCLTVCSQTSLLQMFHGNILSHTLSRTR